LSRSCWRWELAEGRGRGRGGVRESLEPSGEPDCPSSARPFANVSSRFRTAARC